MSEWNILEKLFFYDLETTGVYYWKHGIHQISGAITIDGIVKEKFNFKVCPHEKALIEDDALTIGNVTKDQILSYPKQEIVFKQLTTLIEKYVDRYDRSDKFILVGYNNAKFDNDFFRAFFKQNKNDYFGSYFYAGCIDCYVLAINKLKNELNKLENFKQCTVAKYLGIEVDESKLHDAEYDIEICMEIYKKLNSELPTA